MEQLCKRSGFTNSVWKCHLAVLWVEAISVCNHITCVSKLSCKFIAGVAAASCVKFTTASVLSYEGYCA